MNRATAVSGMWKMIGISFVKKIFFGLQPNSLEKGHLRKMLDMINLHKVKNLTSTMSHHLTDQYKVICTLCNYCTWDQNFKFTGAQLKLLSILQSIISEVSD